MLLKPKKIVTFLLLFSFFSFELSTQQAMAGMISSEFAHAVAKQEYNRARICSFLARQDVEQAMVKHGVNPEEARNRVEGLSDQEVQKVVRVLDRMPAGGDGVGTLVGAAVFIFIVLLITDLLGLTHVFPFVNR